MIENLTTPVTAPLLAATVQAVTFLPLVALSAHFGRAAIVLWVPWCAISLLAVVAIRRAWRSCRAENQPTSALIGLGLNYLYLLVFFSALIAYFSGSLIISVAP